MNLFIDTNIWLSFFHYTSDDLEELNKLGVLLKQNKIRLVLTQQVINEFNRNRENKIADAIKKLREQKLNLQFPQLCKDYPEYEQLRVLQKQYEKQHAAIIEKIYDDVRNRTLKADKLISELFALATYVPLTGELRSAAEARVRCGNPPGKNDSLGDAINWETLLDVVPKGEDLYLISGDGDYGSPIDPETLSQFLDDDWGHNKQSAVFFYRRLSVFFKDKFPAIKLATELEKDLAIKALASCGTFASTHAAIAKLLQYQEFSVPERDALIAAALNNNQIRWILTDPDVNAFYKALITGQEEHIDPGVFAELSSELEPQPVPTDDDTPF